MIHEDTVCLLRECDAGARMGASSIEDVLSRGPSEALSEHLHASRARHDALSREIRAALERFGDEGKPPAAVARGMAWLKTAAEWAVSPTDTAAARLIIDGCDMGVRSLDGYLHKYAAADESSKDIAKRLIALEEGLAADMRDFL